ncbi:hypothetical protein [Pseudomonas sp. YL-218 TE3947]|uniref:hypothetical protein n=1 Tax=Pseudomonas TaxID=286 RepID=UPI003D255800
MKNKVKMTSAIIALALSTTTYALSTSDTLGDWRSATLSEKSSLAQMIADKLSRPGVSESFLIACIDETAGDGGLDQMKISETAAACATLH